MYKANEVVGGLIGYEMFNDVDIESIDTETGRTAQFMLNANLCPIGTCL